MGDMSGDLDLLVRWQGGDRSAANVLVHRYSPPLEALFRYKTNEQDFEDLKQQVWLELTKSRPTEFHSGFRAYLFGIARYVLIRYCEQKQRVPAWDPLTTSLVEIDLSLSQKVAKALGARDLRSTLQRLPLDVQVLLESRYMLDMSTLELAAMYGVPPGTVRSRLHHARKQLAAEIRGAGWCALGDSRKQFEDLRA